MNNIILPIVVLVIVGGGFILLSPADTKNTQQQASVIGSLNTVEETEKTDDKFKEMLKEENKVMEKREDEIMAKEEVMVKDEDVMEKKPGMYTSYSAEKVAQVEGDIILFFHAAWCPSCRTLDSNIEASVNDIPSGVTILKLDYDTETELKQKYGVRLQHTMVQVNNAGDKVQLWAGGNTLQSLLSRI